MLISIRLRCGELGNHVTVNSRINKPLHRQYTHGDILFILYAALYMSSIQRCSININQSNLYPKSLPVPLSQLSPFSLSPGSGSATLATPVVTAAALADPATPAPVLSLLVFSACIWVQGVSV
jgi:hypothetical protein